ncbi:unannotated protein [freshwater metagenome]|uniref:Unannotated protein n=1 Tax=freshwater metagenome TaxID=449393 RepID=A0A6J6NHW4_9ZZZZ
MAIPMAPLTEVAGRTRESTPAEPTKTPVPRSEAPKEAWPHVGMPKADEFCVVHWVVMLFIWATSFG